MQLLSTACGNRIWSQSIGWTVLRTFYGYGIILWLRYPKSLHFVPVWCRCCCNRIGRWRPSYWRRYSLALRIYITTLSVFVRAWIGKQHWSYPVSAFNCDFPVANYLFSLFIPCFRFFLSFILHRSISICLYRHIWHLFSISIRENWPYHCTIGCTRVL